MNMARLEESYSAVRDMLGDVKPTCGIILGSGMSDFAECMTERNSLEFSLIPGLGSPSIEGHSGRLVHAEYSGTELLVFCGRRHWYEGEGWEPVALPPYLLKRFGASVLVLTNAAGGIREDLNTGDIMIIDDHINAIGSQPLVGPHAEIWGERFPDMTRVYDISLRALLDSAAESAGLEVSHGVYLAASGPVYETPAEIRAFRALGADAVGMSTVPEASLAAAAGLRVAAVSCITNIAGCHSGDVSHASVVAASQAAAKQINSLLLAFLERLATEGA